MNFILDFFSISFNFDLFYIIQTQVGTLNYFFIVESLFFKSVQMLCIVVATSAAAVVSIWFNPVYSLLSLVIVFLFSIAYLTFLKVKFLSLVYILIYVGAIVVLFLFIIMMLSLDIAFYNLAKEDWMYSNFGYSLKTIFLTYFLIDLGYNRFDNYYFRQFNENWVSSNIFFEVTFFSNDSLIFNSLLYSQFFFHFILLGFILLVGMIGSITLSSAK